VGEKALRSRKLATQVLEAADRLLVGRDKLAGGCVGRKETCSIRFLRSKAAIQVVEASYAVTNTIRLNVPDTSVIDPAPVYPSPIESQKFDPPTPSPLGGAALGLSEEYPNLCKSYGA
jgi:hypothetical protein